MNTPSEVVQHWASKVFSRPELAKEVDASFKFIVHGSGAWIIDCRGGGQLIEGAAAEKGEADCTISLSASDFVSLDNGSLNPQSAFLMGKIKVEGDASQALKLHNFFRQ